MKKYLLLRSVVIFSVLAFLMMISLGRLALAQSSVSAEIAQRSYHEDQCGRNMTAHYFGDTVSKFSFFAAGRDEKNVRCVPYVQICREKIKKKEESSWIQAFAESVTSSNCLSISLNQMSEGDPNAVVQAMRMLALSKESTGASSERLQRIKVQILDTAKESGDEAGRELLKSHLYNEATLLGGS